MQKITWAVLTDGRYIKIMVHRGDNKLNVLDADKHEDLTALCYKLVHCKPEFLPQAPVKAEETNFMQLQADFLVAEHAKQQYGALIIAAPEKVAAALRAALPDNIKRCIIADLLEDLMTKSADIIEAKLCPLIPIDRCAWFKGEQVIVFTSSSHSDVMMFTDIARKLIDMMGYSGAVPSAISDKDVKSVLTRLKKALAAEAAIIGDDEEADENDQEIAIGNRAFPLIEMLTKAAAEENGIIWYEK